MASPRRDVDAIYPEPLSRLNRVVEQHPSSYKRAIKKKMNRSSGRFRTTPVTFDEIKEVDEECDATEESDSSSAASSSRSEHDLRRQFENFMDRMQRRKPKHSNVDGFIDDTFDLRSSRGRHQSIPEVCDEIPRNYSRKTRPSI